jgi:hypothetical protein
MRINSPFHLRRLQLVCRLATFFLFSSATAWVSVSLLALLFFSQDFRLERTEQAVLMNRSQRDNQNAVKHLPLNSPVFAGFCRRFGRPKGSSQFAYLEARIVQKSAKRENILISAS